MAATWIDIDLDAVEANYREVRRVVNPASRVMAVVKADAYGLGAIPVAQALQAAGCEAFAVTTVTEGVELRQGGVSGLILVLGPGTAGDWPEALDAGLQLTVASSEAITGLAEVAARCGQQASVHLKLDTGMGRLGFLPDELPAVAEALARTGYVKVDGVYTHFARAALRDRRYTQEQYRRFCDMVARLESLGVHPQWRHVCNSAALLDYPEWHFDFVRTGTLLVGHYPAPGFSSKLKLQDPWQAKSRVLSIRTVPKGTYVGYQSAYRTRRETQLAVIAAGYADGFGVEPHLTPQGFVDLVKILLKQILAWLRIYLGREKVELNGRTVAVAGKIGMQLTVLDVGKEPCQVGDEVKLPMRRTLANPRLLRRYWRAGRICGERSGKAGFLPCDREYGEYV